MKRQHALFLTFTIVVHVHSMAHRCGPNFLLTGSTRCWLLSLSPDGTWIYVGVLRIAAGNTGFGPFTRPCIHSLKSMLMQLPIQLRASGVSAGWACPVR